MAIDDTLERLCNLLRSEAWVASAKVGLQPIHLHTLRYLAVCNRYSDTPLAVAEFLGQTKGSVSQTLKLLAGKGLVAKQSDAADRRLVHLTPTPAALELLAQTKSELRISQAAADLDETACSALDAGLTGLLRALQIAHGRRVFGVCSGCRFNERHAGGYRCGLTGELLSGDDVTRICREYEAPGSV
ncbi:MAG: MarR family winged helix-turn-helix transcriptional regulator [Chromatiaceae bacterium]|jgi:DNA-binding MarR family transcriptional regulator|nr:MarR family winged helix-turn-helix transcriptional regulator [Chromatiaceae bacterium]MCF7994467.1 MarR family winged helix-turn-helix transcriptional regulator [Chromatiaceae bacterium]MCF8016666.1 MarR family winged helix-turn-helix transcriptional regulator [Chromatiaceae bacterium]